MAFGAVWMLPGGERMLLGDCWGQFCYVRDLHDNRTWSIGRQPSLHAAGIYDHAFFGDRADFRCLAEDIETSWSAFVAPEVDAELRI